MSKSRRPYKFKRELEAFYTLSVTLKLMLKSRRYVRVFFTLESRNLNILNKNVTKKSYYNTFGSSFIRAPVI